MKAAKKKVAKKAAKKGGMNKKSKDSNGQEGRRGRAGAGGQKRPTPTRKSARGQRPTDHLELPPDRPSQLNGFGGMGEGLSMQMAKDGRRILWAAHESAPKNFTAMDVTDPRNPKVVVQTDLPHQYAVQLSRDRGDVMAVAYQTKKVGMAAGGFRTVRYLHARDAEIHRLLRLRPALIRAECTSSGSATASMSISLPARAISSRRPEDDQFYRCWTCATRRSPRRSAAGGCRAPRVATTRRRSTRHPAWTMASARTTPTSIRSARTASISALSMAGCTSSTPDKSMPPVSNWTNSPPYTASPTPSCRCSVATCSS